MTDDQSLAVRLSRDLHGVFPEVVDVFQGAVYSVALHSLKSKDDAADVAAETFVRAFGALLDYQPRRIAATKLRPWLVTIALNACRNIARSNQRFQQFALGSTDPTSHVDPVERSDDRTRLKRALLDLPTRQRTAVVLRYIVDFSYEEIGHVLDCPSGTAKSDVSRGLARLRNLLERSV